MVKAIRRAIRRVGGRCCSVLWWDVGDFRAAYWTAEHDFDKRDAYRERLNHLIRDYYFFESEKKYHEARRSLGLPFIFTSSLFTFTSNLDLKDDAAFEEIPVEYRIFPPTSHDMNIPGSVCEFDTIVEGWTGSDICRLELKDRLPDKLVASMDYEDRRSLVREYRWLGLIDFLRDWAIAWLIPLLAMVVLFILGEGAIHLGLKTYRWVADGFNKI